MKILASLLTAVFLLGPFTLPANSAVHVSVNFFHDSLESYGDWREVGDYGYCWQPRGVDRDWRPYSDGHWIYTDAGWTWDSEEPYSWAVYHYGRWARVDRVGWVWVPGTEWGPAWVSWRRSPRHVGWAPLPPEAEFSRSVGFDSRVDANYDIGPTNYNFVEVRNFGAPRLRTVIVERQKNITIINQSTNITNVTYVNNVVYNQGPQYDVISRVTTQPIRRLKLERRDGVDPDPNTDADPRTIRAEQLKARIKGDTLQVVALPVDASPATTPKKVTAKLPTAAIDRGWKNAGPEAEIAKTRAKVKHEAIALTTPPDQAPPATPTKPTQKDKPSKPDTHPKALGSEATPPAATGEPAEKAKIPPTVKPPQAAKKPNLKKGVERPKPMIMPDPAEAQPVKGKKEESKTEALKPHPAVDVAPRQQAPVTPRRVSPPSISPPQNRSVTAAGGAKKPSERPTQSATVSYQKPQAPKPQAKTVEPRKVSVPTTQAQPAPVKSKGKGDKKDEPKPNRTPQ